MAGMPHTKLLIAELMLIKVSIISPYRDTEIREGKRKENVIVSKIHHVLCPMVFDVRRSDHLSQTTPCGKEKPV
jgi:hypothetical protein